MASIIGLLDLLLDDDLTSPQRGNVTQIRECASGLLGLLNDLLDISKVSGRAFLWLSLTNTSQPGWTIRFFLSFGHSCSGLFQLLIADNGLKGSS